MRATHATSALSSQDESVGAAAVPSPSDSLALLMKRGALWRGQQHHRWSPHVGTDEASPTGFDELDAVLGGGWPRGDLLELLVAGHGMGEIRLFEPLMKGCARVLWVDPPWLPHGAALGAAGMDLSRLIVIRTRSLKERLWATEQALKSGCCDLVLSWFDAVQGPWLRRLQLAVTEGGGTGVVLRSARFAEQGSAAPWRLRLDRRETSPERLRVHAFKRKGAMPAPCVEIDLSSSRLSPPAGRANRDAGALFR
ncbi:translesion DNA synthesis-associated protein ImuA [Halomonas sp. V046]|uniref:translesion DNA synthesis-associated protein ImuA n=1 Tax=Halomonas sp. V046 TaxID=3459611 RepID=UPI004044AEE5